MSKQRMMPAINLALQEEMKRDNKVILYGEDAGISLLGQTTGLQENFLVKTGLETRQSVRIL